MLGLCFCFSLLCVLLVLQKREERADCITLIVFPMSCDC